MNRLNRPSPLKRSRIHIDMNQLTNDNDIYQKQSSYCDKCDKYEGCDGLKWKEAFIEKERNEKTITKHFEEKSQLEYTSFLFTYQLNESDVDIDEPFSVSETQEDEEEMFMFELPN